MNANVTEAGELRQWHRVTLDVVGPDGGENRETFYDKRMDVTFTNAETGEKITVPGFFAADGDAANTGATSGNIWRVHFNPPETGEWTYSVSFREGDDVAASTNPNAGTPVAGVDGTTGSLTILESDKTGADFRAHGMLEYVGEHYLVHAGSGQAFVKAGPGSPENFLAYEGFDGTVDTHAYQPHVGDWNPGDPTWAGGEGKGIIGAVNYLASEGLNSIYLMLNTAGGDGQDVWPWADPNLDDIGKNTANISASRVSAFDVSKLDQWEAVFQHMDENGISIHAFLQETENDQLLNNGNLGPERAVYMREMIARFSHHNGLIWDLGEENTNTPAQLRDHAGFLEAMDPYSHLVVTHTYPGQKDQVYDPQLGNDLFDGASIQDSSPRDDVLKWREESADAGRKWVVNWDETGPANRGLDPDSGGPFSGNNQDERRIEMWKALMAGAAGVEWYFGYQNPNNDLNLEDFRSRDQAWDWTADASAFFETLPLTEMEVADNATPQSGDYVFAKAGDTYVVYLEKGGSASLDLSAFQGDFTVRWFDPRNGGDLQNGSVTSVSGGNVVALGSAPNNAGEDWAILVQANGSVTPNPDPGPDSDPGPDPVPPVAVGVDIYLIDAATDQRIEKLADGAVIDPADLSSGQFSIEAVPTGPGVGSVRLSLSGGASQVENMAPYALFGDNGGDFAGKALPSGTQSIKVELFSGANAGGALLGAVTLGFEVADVAPPPPVNADPDAVDDGVVLDQDGSVTINVLANDDDSDGDSLTISAVGTPSNGTAEIVNGQIVYTPDAGFSGTDGFGYTVSDGNGGTDTAEVSVRVDAVAPPDPEPEPELEPVIPPVSGGGLLQLFVGFTDSGEELTPLEDGTMLQQSDMAGRKVTIYAVPSGDQAIGSVRLDVPGVNSRIENVTPYALFGDSGGNFHPGAELGDGIYALTVTAYSGRNGTGTVLETVSLDFSVEAPEVNTPPEAVDDSAVAEAGQAVAIDVLANDSDDDGDDLSFEITTGPSKGSAEIVAGQIVYTPDEDASGADEITYTLRDGRGGESTAIVGIDVNAAPPPPPAVPASAYLQFFLADVRNDKFVADVVPGQPVDISGYEDARLTLAAEALPGVTGIGSVRLTIDGRAQVENVTPYALFGDIKGDFRGGMVFDDGAHEITIEVFSGKRASGTLLEKFDLTFDTGTDIGPAAAGFEAGLDLALLAAPAEVDSPAEPAGPDPSQTDDDGPVAHSMFDVDTLLF